MGALCDSGSSTHIHTTTEITALKSTLSQYQTLTHDYQSQILKAQEEVKSLISKEAKERDESLRIKGMLLTDIRRIWTVIQDISALLDLKPEQDLKPGINKEDPTIEDFYAEIKDSFGREKTEIERLGLVQEEINTCIQVGLEEMQKDLRLLGKPMVAIDGTEGQIPVLQTVLGQFSGFVEESIRIEDTNVQAFQHVSALQTELVALASTTSGLETDISRQETLNQDLNSALSEVQTALQQHQSDQVSVAQESLALEQRRTDLVAKQETFLDEISRVRYELMELKEAIKEFDLKNCRLEDEIGKLTALRSREEIEQYSMKLTESIAALKTLLQQLQTDALEKETLLLTTVATVSTLEQKVTALNEKAANADLGEKMASMQATLQDLISTLGENASDSDEST